MSSRHGTRISRGEPTDSYGHTRRITRDIGRYWRWPPPECRLGDMDPPSTNEDQSSSSVGAPRQTPNRSAPPPVQVFIVDDHALGREGTLQLLERAPDIEVTGRAGSGEEAIAILELLQPHVAIIDLNLPGMSGLDLARLTLVSHPQMRVLIVSAYDEHAFVAEAIDIGVGGYLLKTATAKELVDAIRAVADGVFVLDRELSIQLTRKSSRDTTNSDLLTPRETDVLSLLAQGRSNKQIANDLGLGQRTVEGHVSSILGKLGVQSRTEAVAFALGSRLVRPSNHDNPHHAR